MNLTPEQLAILAAVGGFLARDVFPWFRGLVDAEFKSRQEERRASITDRDERFIKALEQSAAAQQMMAKAAVDTAAALQVSNQLRTADNLVLQRLERRVDEMHDDRRMSPRARARGYDEGAQ